MALGDQQFDKLLSRAWAAVWDCQNMAENQGRHAARKRIQFAARILGEVQADVRATETAQRAGGEAAMRRYERMDQEARQHLGRSHVGSE